MLTRSATSQRVSMGGDSCWIGGPIGLHARARTHAHTIVSLASSRWPPPARRAVHLPYNARRRCCTPPDRYNCKEGEYNDVATLFLSSQHHTIIKLFSVGHDDDDPADPDNLRYNPPFTLGALALYTTLYLGLMSIGAGLAIPGGLFMPSIVVRCAAPPMHACACLARPGRTPRAACMHLRRVGGWVGGCIRFIVVQGA